MLNVTGIALTVNQNTQWFLENEQTILLNFLYTVLGAAALVALFYGGGRLLDWICRKKDKK